MKYLSEPITFFRPYNVLVHKASVAHSSDLALLRQTAPFMMPNPFRMGAEMNIREDILKLSTYGVPDELVASYAARRVAILLKIL